jgi:hypothetical protein
MSTNIGQRITKNFTLVNSGVSTSFPLFCEDKFDCNFKIPVYANTSGLDLENDKSGVHILGKTWLTGVVYKIQKSVGGSWVTQATIADQTYGEWYDLGSKPDYPKYSGVVIYWSVVLAAFGTGGYRIQAIKTIPIGNQTVNSQEYCLNTLNCLPDTTVRLEWYMNKGIGDIDSDRDVLNYGDTNSYYQVRLPLSFFGYPRSEYETEEIQYSNGMFENITDVQSETYTLKIGGIPAWLHNIIKTYALASGKQ